MAFEPIFAYNPFLTNPQPFGDVCFSSQIQHQQQQFLFQQQPQQQDLFGNGFTLNDTIYSNNTMTNIIINNNTNNSFYSNEFGIDFFDDIIVGEPAHDDFINDALSSASTTPNSCLSPSASTINSNSTSEFETDESDGEFPFATQHDVEILLPQQNQWQPNNLYSTAQFAPQFQQVIPFSSTGVVEVAVATVSTPAKGKRGPKPRQISTTQQQQQQQVVAVIKVKSTRVGRPAKSTTVNTPAITGIPSTEIVEITSPTKGRGRGRAKSVSSVVATDSTTQSEASSVVSSPATVGRVTKVSRKNKSKRNRRADHKHKRDLHNDSERLRRSAMRQSLEDLRLSVPEVMNNPKVHTSHILRQAIAFIKKLEAEDRAMEVERKRLQSENRKLLRSI